MYCRSMTYNDGVSISLRRAIFWPVSACTNWSISCPPFPSINTNCSTVTSGAGNSSPAFRSLETITLSHSNQHTCVSVSVIESHTLEISDEDGGERRVGEWRRELEHVLDACRDLTCADHLFRERHHTLAGQELQQLVHQIERRVVHCKPETTRERSCVKNEKKELNCWRKANQIPVANRSCS